MEGWINKPISTYIDFLHEEKQKALKKLQIDIAKIKEDVLIKDKDDPINKFKLQFCKTGSYLKPDDMNFCIEKTNFIEEQIVDWFKRFRTIHSVEKFQSWAPFTNFRCKKGNEGGQDLREDCSE